MLSGKIFLENFKARNDNDQAVQFWSTKMYLETFQLMYESIPFEMFGCEGWSMKEMVEDTYEIYTFEQEKQWGALAITIKV